MTTEIQWLEWGPDAFARAATEQKPVLLAIGAAWCRWTEEMDRVNLRILERLNRSGEVLLTHTVLNGRVVLRLSIGNLRTTPAHVRRVWELLREAADAEEQGAVG